MVDFDRDREARNAASRARRRANPAKAREASLRQRFGLTLADYDAMAVSQGHVCAICGNAETSTRRGQVKNLAVDHDHRTGAVRALLCQRCNTAIGAFEDSEQLLFAAIDYLRRHRRAA